MSWWRHAPQAATALLAVLAAVDAGDFVRVLRALPPERAGTPATRASAHPARTDVRRVVDAHLFGADPTAAPAAASAAAIELALSGIVATNDRGDGYAILGEKGKPTHLYMAGAAVAGLQQATVLQVFWDRVVLNIGGEVRMLRLPRTLAPTLVSPQGLMAATAPVSVPAHWHAVLAETEKPRQASAAESWFGSLYAQRHADGGLMLHPSMRYQREYGLRNGDILTAVNGVEINDPQALAEALSTSDKSVALTFTRDGVPRTETFPVQN